MFSKIKDWVLSHPAYLFILFLVTLVGIIAFGIWRHDPYAETVEAACYPDTPLTWKKAQPGNRLFVVCALPDGTVTKEVEVKQK